MSESWVLVLTLTVPMQVRLLGEHTDHEPEEIEKTISRPKYFDPYEAVKYGIIDRVSCSCILCAISFPLRQSSESVQSKLGFSRDHSDHCTLGQVCGQGALQRYCLVCSETFTLPLHSHVWLTMFQASQTFVGSQVLEPDEVDLKKVIRQ